MPSQGQLRTIHLIDEPTPFAPIEEWRAFLADLEAEPERTEQIEAVIRKAKEHIAQAER